MGFNSAFKGLKEGFLHSYRVWNLSSLLYRAACCFNLFFIVPTHVLYFTKCSEVHEFEQ